MSALPVSRMRTGLAVFSIALFAAPPVAAQMYKCVDERGITHYSDKPRPECKASEVDIRPSPPISGSLTPYKEDLKAAERDFQRRQAQRAREEAALTRKREQQQRKCAGLKAEYGRLTSGRRTSTFNAQGERVFLDDETREKRAARLREEITSTCR